MAKLKFSIITPVNVWNQKRADDFVRCQKSVEKQTFSHDKFEHIIVNDGSTIDFKALQYSFVKVINQSHNERVIAYNKALPKALGDVFCFLDSDDEYDPDYLSRVYSMFEKYPEYKMFNFGSRMIHKDGVESSRGSFQPKMLDFGHEEFGGGNIVNGTFVFHRSIFEDLGAYPSDVLKNIDTTEINYPPFKGAPKPYIRDLHMNTPYDFSAAAQIEFPEIRKYFMIDHIGEPEKIIKELGNPFGNDYYLFYKYTRKYHSKPMDDILYWVHLK